MKLPALPLATVFAAVAAVAIAQDAVKPAAPAVSQLDGVKIKIDKPEVKEVRPDTTLLPTKQYVRYEGKTGPGKGKHVVLLSGDEEYRSEEAMPMLGRLLAERLGFKCTVLFAVDPDGTINPNNQASLPGSSALDSADLIIMSLRFRKWPDDDMERFAKAINRGVPVIGLRTSTHAFSGLKGEYAKFNKFGENYLGEEWISHWGSHKKEGTRAVLEPGADKDPIMTGVADIFGDTDVYEAYPPADAKILLRGMVTKTLDPTSEPASYQKKRATDKVEQDVNNPMMPIAWTLAVKNDAGNFMRTFCTTLGSATDLQNPGLRRLIVNVACAFTGLEVPAKVDVTPVGDFQATMYGFNGFKKGLRPEGFEAK
jgi:hypothetical protein